MASNNTPVEKVLTLTGSYAAVGGGTVRLPFKGNLTAKSDNASSISIKYGTGGDVIPLPAGASIGIDLPQDINQWYALGLNQVLIVSGDTQPGW